MALKTAQACCCSHATILMELEGVYHQRQLTQNDTIQNVFCSSPIRNETIVLEIPRWGKSSCTFFVWKLIETLEKKHMNFFHITVRVDSMETE